MSFTQADANFVVDALVHKANVVRRAEEDPEVRWRELINEIDDYPSEWHVRILAIAGLRLAKLTTHCPCGDASCSDC